MKTIDQLIQEKRQQVERLNAQLEVLEELAAEAGSLTSRGGPRIGRPPARSRRRARAGRGANQRRVLKVLTATPMRARDIAAAARLSPAATNQVLMGLRKNRIVEQSGRGLYRVAAKRPAPRPAGPLKPKKGGRRRTPKPRKPHANRVKSPSQQSDTPSAS